MSATSLSLLLVSTLMAHGVAGGDPISFYDQPLSLRVEPVTAVSDDDVVARKSEPRRRNWHLIAFPMFMYRSDDGPGFGGVFSTGYRHDGAWPFEARLRLRASATTKWVQRHEALGEVSSRVGLPLSLRVAVGWYSTRSYNYCGTGNGVTCSVEDAEKATRLAHLDVDAAEEMLDKYYRVRFMEPYLQAEARARVWSGALSVDTFARLRSVYHLPGEHLASTPYPGSLYARDFPDGERGAVLVPELGIAFDTRDFLALPGRGLFIEGSVRGASTFWGSGSNFAGLYASAVRWWPVGGPGRAVLGTRVVADALVGDVPTLELARTGGSDPHAIFGGAWMGRGIREARYIGKIKIIPQVELRTSVLRVWLLRNEFDVGVGFFGDAAWIGNDWDDLAGDGGDPLRILWTVGTGLRILINQDNVLRLDVAISPFEERGPQFYGYSGKTGVAP